MLVVKFWKYEGKKESYHLPYIIEESSYGKNSE